MDTSDYTVALETFEGPLDLLLHLIRRAEVDICDIPIATIADQYVRYLEGIERIDIDLAGEFLLMAATLTEIKARSLAPQEQRQRAEGEQAAPADPRQELVEQLLAYKRYRDAADRLESRLAEWQQREPVAPVGVSAPEFQAALEAAGDVDVEDLDLIDLVEAFERICESVNFERLGDHRVLDDETPIELHAADLVDQLTRLREEGGEARMPLRAALVGRTRAEAIGLFLATLELVRQRRLRVRKDEEGGISLELREPDALADTQPEQHIHEGESR
ncbi:MAG: segregation and condensation protein A [Phycisphaerales bacterium JB039]